MKQYWYVVCLFTEDCYGNFIEEKGNQTDGCPVCIDFSAARRFETTDKAHKFAHECGYQNGEYSIHGYYF